MARLLPFRALRPVPDRAARVAAVPYDVVDVDEARALAAGNPLSFLHVSRAEIDLAPGTDPYSPAVYEAAATRFAALKAAAPLYRDKTPSVFVCRLRAGSHEQTGVAGCYSLDEYDSGVIKKHEETRPAKVEDRTRHMLALAAQTGPVFLTYRAQAAVDDLVGRLTLDVPLVDFEAADGVRHTLWRAKGLSATCVAQAFAAVPALYIADGHHRAASAARARSLLGQSNIAAESFLAVAFPHTQVRILPYNRIVRDLGGRSPEAFLELARTRASVAPGGPTPSRSGQISMYLAGLWYALEFTSGEDAAGGIGASLDVSQLERRLLGPILNIGDVRTDPRIDFVGGASGTKSLEQLVDGGRGMVAFSMYPVGVEQLMAIADAGQSMPPKSTWFDPKLRDGLLVHEL
jgi:uncharacterized protein (DUF1015 family)